MLCTFHSGRNLYVILNEVTRTDVILNEVTRTDVILNEVKDLRAGEEDPSLALRMTGWLSS